MPGWNHESANWKLKNCQVCNTEFKPFSGAHKFCSVQCKNKWKYISGQFSTEEQYKKISGNWSRYCARLLYYGGRHRSKLTRADILRQLEKQNFRCAISGVQLTCELQVGVKSPTNATVDRIIAGGGYTPDNIQIVCRVMNQWRCNTPVDEFIRWCKVVAAYNSQDQPPHSEVTHAEEGT